MTGLKVVDDHTFTIKTTEKVSNLPVRLGYSAFAPLPGRVLRRTRRPSGQADRQRPVQDRRVDQGAVRSSCRSSPTTRVTFGAKLDKITFKIYQDTDAAYNDVLANNLDVTDEIPTSALIDDKYKTDLPTATRRRKSAHPDGHRSPPAKVDPNTRTRRSARRSRWRSTARRSSSRSSTAPACRPPAGSPRSSTATRPRPVR